MILLSQELEIRSKNFSAKASKKHLKKLIESAEVLTLVSHDKGKFGRILGELFVYHNYGHPVHQVEYSINQQMIDDHHVDYGGGNKEEIQEKHLEHRKILINEGVVTQEEIDKVS